jgi:excinuclease ABC subunit A
MNLEQLQAFFSTGETKDEKRIAEMIQPLISVGLGYLKAGQSSTTLSGGEAQRIKLAYFLAKGSTQGKTLFVFDEPTTGLHVHDIVQLLKAFNDLIDLGHSLIVIEHNLDVIKSADHLIDLGPEGGIEGGRVVFEGSPEALVLLEENHTAAALRGKIIH